MQKVSSDIGGSISNQEVFSPVSDAIKTVKISLMFLISQEEI